jgi:6,7-dimethyl-8-ribityllumazine synthase
MRSFEGDSVGPRLRVAIVVSKYHDFVTDRLQRGALSALAAADVSVSVRLPAVEYSWLLLGACWRLLPMALSSTARLR